MKRSAIEGSIRISSFVAHISIDDLLTPTQNAESIITALSFLTRPGHLKDQAGALRLSIFA